MFRRKRSVNDLKRKMMCMCFLIVFIAGGISLSGMLQANINSIDNNPKPIQVSSTDDYEDESIELLEPIEIEKVQAKPLAIAY